MASRVLPPARLLAVVAPVSVAGVAAFAAATVAYALDPGSWTAVAGVAAFFVCSTFAERFPVPVEGADVNGVSLGFVFAVAGLALFGWAAGTFVYAAAPLIVGLAERKPGIRTAFNAGAFGLGGSAAGLILRQLGGTGLESDVTRVFLTTVTLYVVNLVLVTAAIAASGGAPGYPTLIRSMVRRTVVPFTMMASTALMLVVLWERTPYLFFALLGPLLAISLYQRSTHRALSAIRLALTDPLTGLGNQRHFHERLQRALAPGDDAIVSLCLLDVDDFKRINDRYGHPTGDRVLALVASQLRQGGEAFRLGGDEFAILLPGADERRALEIAEAIVGRIGDADFAPVGELTVSAGVATFPLHGRERDALIRLADGALYWAKEHGKNQVRAARPDAGQLADFRHDDNDGAPAFGRFRAAASLAGAVDVREGYEGSHSERVGALAERVAERLGLPADQVELARLAGHLHDVGKLAIPEEILRKPATLNDAERLVLERHPQIGHRMLVSLGVETVAESVLHHHERWDGSGYPTGLAGAEIPLAARIVFVADAYDAIVAGRPYAARRSSEQACEEIERCAGTQFDPEVAAALVSVVDAREPVGV